MTLLLRQPPTRKRKDCHVHPPRHKQPVDCIFQQLMRLIPFHMPEHRDTRDWLASLPVGKERERERVCHPTDSTGQFCSPKLPATLLEFKHAISRLIWWTFFTLRHSGASKCLNCLFCTSPQMPFGPYRDWLCFDLPFPPGKVFCFAYSEAPIYRFL